MKKLFLLILLIGALLETNAHGFLETEINSSKSRGFYSVRLPIHYNLFTLPIVEETLEDENTRLTEGFEMMDNHFWWHAQIQMYVILDLHTAAFQATVDWHNRETISKRLSFTTGAHHMRLLITQPPFDINFFSFTFLASAEDMDSIPKLNIFPKPSMDIFELRGNLTEPQIILVNINNLRGQLIYCKSTSMVSSLNEKIDLSLFESGNYFLTINLENGSAKRKKLT